jgi:hypothetical protein
MADAVLAGGTPTRKVPAHREAPPVEVRAAEVRAAEPRAAEPRAARPHARPNPLPSRLALGVGALAAASVIGAGIGRLSGEAVAAPQPEQSSTAAVAAVAPRDRTRVERPVRYVRLKAGERAPAGARVIQEKAPAPRVVVRWVSPGTSSTVSPATPTRRAPVARTRQSGG